MSVKLRVRLKNICRSAILIAYSRGERPTDRALGTTSDRGGAVRQTGVILLAAALMSVPAWSQTTTGRLMGATVDEEGVALPGVSVTTQPSNGSLPGSRGSQASRGH